MSSSMIVQELENAFAKAVLGAVAELPFAMGYEKTINVLKGAKSRYILEYELFNVPSYGVFSMFTAEQLHTVLEALVKADLLVQDKVAEFRPVLKITTKGREFLQGRLRLGIQTGLFAQAQMPQMDLESRDRFARLRKLRNAIAFADDVAAYAICSDNALMELAVRMPAQKEQLYDIPGLPDRFIEQYGDRFLRELAAMKKQ